MDLTTHHAAVLQILTDRVETTSRDVRAAKPADATLAESAGVTARSEYTTQLAKHKSTRYTHLLSMITLTDYRKRVAPLLIEYGVARDSIAAATTPDTRVVAFKVMEDLITRYNCVLYEKSLKTMELPTPPRGAAICDDCGGVDTLEDQEFVTVCSVCGYVILQHSTHPIVSSKRVPWEYQNHLNIKSHLQYIQCNTFEEVPEYLFEYLTTALDWELSWNKMETCTNKSIYVLLNEAKKVNTLPSHITVHLSEFRNYYRCIMQIRVELFRRLRRWLVDNDRTPPDWTHISPQHFSSTVLDNIFDIRLPRIKEVYNAVVTECSPKRKHFFSSHYLIYQLLRLEGVLTVTVDDFTIVKDTTLSNVLFTEVCSRLMELHPNEIWFCWPV